MISRPSLTDDSDNRHPTGFFVRGDKSQLDGIIRKTRTRQAEKGRRDSLASTTSADDSATSPFPQYDDGQPGPSYSNVPGPPFGYGVPGQAGRAYPPPPPPPPLGLPHDSMASWRNYPQAGMQSAPAAMSSFPPPLGGQPPHAQAYEYSQWSQQQTYRRGSLTQFRVETSPRSKPADLPGSQAYQTTLRTHSPLALNDPATAPDGSDFRSPYASQAFPPEQSGHTLPPAHGYHIPSQAPSAPPPHARGALPSGLPLSFDPLTHRPSWPPTGGSTYANVPPPLQQPTIPSLQSYDLHQSHGPSGGPPGAVASPTHSPEEDGLPPHTHAPPPPPPTQRAYYDASYGAQQQPHGHQPPLHHQPPSNLFPNLTHYYPPPAGLAASHAQPYSHAHHQAHSYPDGRRASVQLPPFGPGPSALPVPQQQQQQQLAGAGVGGGGGGAGSCSSGRTTPTHGSSAPGSGKLGWALPPLQGVPPPPGPGAGQGASVFGQWPGFGPREGLAAPVREGAEGAVKREEEHGAAS